MSSTSLPIARPSLTLLGAEPWRAAYEFAAHKLFRETSKERGDGHPVVVFPGLGTDGVAVAPMRDHCRSLGYHAIDWGRGLNRGPQGNVDGWLEDLQAHTEALLDGFDQSATLIGWSLGGIYARELAKTMGPRVRQVITIGTPFNAAADHTHVGWIYRLLSGQSPKLDNAWSARLRTPPPVPTTSIYSRSDGVVAWQSCRHVSESHQVQDLEVSSSHIGLGWNRAVLRIVADRLAQRPGQWRRYEDASARAQFGRATPD